MSTEDTQHLRAKSAKGFAWQTIGNVLAQPISTLATIILAHLLVPGDFGLAAMATIVTGLAAVVNEFGLTDALVQRPNLTDDEIDSAFWLNMGIGVALLGLGVLAAIPVARFYGQPMLVWILPASSVTFVIASISLVPKALLYRRMDFRPRAISGVVAALAMLIVAVALALRGAGVWSIVLGNIASQGAMAAYLWWSCGWRPRLHYRWAEARPLFQFGGTLMLANLVNYGASNIDNLLVGRYLGSSSLGVYTLAFNFSSAVTSKIFQTAATTAFPAFSRIKDELERFRAAFVDAVSFTALPTGVLLATVAVLAQEVIQGLFGTQWSAAIIPLRVLCAASFVMAITTFTSLVFKGLGHPEKELLWSVVLLVASGAGAAAGLRFGITGVACGITAGVIISRVLAQLDANRMISLSIRHYAAALLPSLVAAGLAALIAATLRHVLLMLGAPPLVRLIVAGPAAVAGTWLLLRVTPFRRPVRSVEHLVLGVLRSRFSNRAIQ